jgi:hypothetical protein
MAKTLKERIIELREIHNPSNNDVDDDNHPRESRTRWGHSRTGTRSRRRGGGGWKRTLYFGAIWASMILILNLVLVIWASTRRSPEGASVLYAGDCARTKQISSWVHVLINMLSTGMLGASHFAMVCRSMRPFVIPLCSQWRFPAMSECAGARGRRSRSCRGEMA